MSINRDWLMPYEVRNPDRPQPMNFAFRETVDHRQLSFCRDMDDRRRLFDDLKRRAAHALAQHIAKHCKWFDASPPTYGELAIQLELTISDRGSYENWLPVERQAGRREGREQALKQCAESLPYGLAEAAMEFYT